MQNNNINSYPCPACDMELLIRLNVMLASNPNFSKSVNTALKMIGDHLKNDRIHIFEIHPDRSLSILHEWCNQQIPAIKDTVQKRKINFNPELEKQLYDQNYISIDQADELTNNEINHLLQEDGSRNVILFPLYQASSQFAFIAFSKCNDQHTWSECEIRMITTISSIIAAHMDKDRIFKNLAHHLEIKKKREEKSEALIAQMVMLYSKIQHEWRQLKETLPSTELQHAVSLEQHINTLNELCKQSSLRS